MIFASWESIGPWLESLLTILTRDEFRFILVLLYHIWNRHDTFMHENLILSVWHVVPSSRPLLRAFDNASGLTGLDRLASEKMLSAIDMLARDYNGLVVSCQASPYYGPCDISVAETETLRYGIKMTLDLQAPLVTIDSDTLNVVRQLTLTQLDMSIVGFHLTEARNLLR
ncbi:hypothetical protein F3Y22_tig00111758pilonHSYRG00376 [Hibiscus syriacus]|uniref:RNase H type-1 domain-containing protein n=1 Tax=Hibiscus syriacus TaxID=106335 RepID=A0A6A2Y214_HIBSY|nr:hypothetical protein F3Y22_tig00111758pilonHSYRG00376 [Hibiscus syriacus]